MLYALGIYTYHKETGKINLIHLAQKDKPEPNVPNQLYDLEKHFLSGSAFELKPDRIAFNEAIIEYQYVRRDTKYEVILAIVSRDWMDLPEVKRLFINMIHIHRKENNPSITLQSLIENPLLQEELVVNKINKTNQETKEMIIENLDILLDRGESLDKLVEKSKNLHTDAVKLESGAKKASRCHYNCW